MLPRVLKAAHDYLRNLRYAHIYGTVEPVKAEILSIGTEILLGEIVDTNASYIVGEQYAFHDGLFSGFDQAKGEYVQDSWGYQADPTSRAYAVDPTLQNPRCVFQLLKKHVERYTPEMVERICGVPRQTFLKVAELVTSTGGADLLTSSPAACALRTPARSVARADGARRRAR